PSPGSLFPAPSALPFSLSAYLRPARCSTATAWPRAEGARLAALGRRLVLAARTTPAPIRARAPRLPALCNSALKPAHRGWRGAGDRGGTRPCDGRPRRPEATAARGPARVILGAQLLICAASPRAGRIQSRRSRFLSQDFKSLQEPPSLFPAPTTVSSGGERGEKCCHGSSPVAGADERCGSKATSLEANDIELQGLLLLHSNHGTHVSAYGVVRVGRQ
ncbi:unnamed protein product, partial [Urochloa humidicola]